MITKSLFIKLLSSFLLITVLAISTISISLYLLVENYLYEAKESELRLKSKQISTVVLHEIEADHSVQQVIRLLQWPDTVVGTHIMVLDSLGKIIAVSDESFSLGELASAEIIKAARGDVVIFSDMGVKKTPFLSVGTPLVRGTKTVGAVVMYAPIGGIDTTINQMKRLILSGALIAIAFASVTAVLLSNAISQPIRMMSAHALLLAQGKFENRVEEKETDELGQLARALNYMAGELEKQHEAQQFLEAKRREFVANVSHELRSPLTSINGYVEALLDGKAKDETATKKYLSIIHKEGTRMDRLINELLVLSRLQAGKVELQLEAQRLRPLIDQVVQQLEPLITERDLRMSIKIRDENYVLVDGDKIKQVLLNLLSNAIKFTPIGGYIEITSGPKDNGVIVSITDSGIGIPEEELPFVWDRFHKVDKSRTPNAGGIGLGLAISKELILHHGGTVSAKSTYRHGSTFSFWLPVDYSDERTSSNEDES